MYSLNSWLMIIHMCSNFKRNSDFVIIQNVFEFNRNEIRQVARQISIYIANKRFVKCVFRWKYLMILLMFNAFADSTKTIPFGLLPLKMGNIVALSISRIVVFWRAGITLICVVYNVFRCQLIYDVKMIIF